MVVRRNREPVYRTGFYRNPNLKNIVLPSFADRFGAKVMSEFSATSYTDAFSMSFKYFLEFLKEHVFLLKRGARLYFLFATWCGRVPSVARCALRCGHDDAARFCVIGTCGRRDTSRRDGGRCGPPRGGLLPPKRPGNRHRDANVVQSMLSNSGHGSVHACSGLRSNNIEFRSLRF